SLAEEKGRRDGTELIGADPLRAGTANIRVHAECENRLAGWIDQELVFGACGNIVETVDRRSARRTQVKITGGKAQREIARDALGKIQRIRCRGDIVCIAQPG